MPHITTQYKMYLPGGHHRQPRNTDTELALAPSSGGDTPYSPPFFPQLPYTLPGGGGNGDAKLLFWSETDGTSGIVRPPTAFDIPAATSPRTVTGWYFPVSGPAIGDGIGSAIIDDAFSARLGTFIDDSFVDVTSDPSLTSDANVIGVVPTNADETLTARTHVTSIADGFSQWLLNDQIMPQGQTALNVAKGTDGLAIAVYRAGDFTVPPLSHDAEWVRIIAGVIQDGGGLIWGPHGPVPVDPWGALIGRLMQSGLTATVARAMPGKAASEVRRIATRDAVSAIKEALTAFQRSGGGK